MGKWAKRAKRAAASVLGASLLLTAGAATAQTIGQRVIVADAGAESRPRDRMADFSVGADYPAVTGREDALAQLQVAREELGFRYIRFHAIFHDDMGVYREVDGQPVYDFSKIDALYDRFLAMGIKPFVELGFTPDGVGRALASGRSFTVGRMLAAVGRRRRVARVTRSRIG